MFYWTVNGREIVLTDAEENEIMHRAGFTATERVGFFIVVRGKRSPLQDRLGRFLEEYAARDPRAFELEFVRRSGVGPEHLPELRALIDAYTRTHGRLRWGAPPAAESSEHIDHGLWLHGRRDIVSLTIMHPVRRWLRNTWEVAGSISFPSAEIERFYGNGTSLFIATSRMMIRAGGSYIQIIQLPADETDAPWHLDA